MYISYGWPKVLAALEPGCKHEEVVYIAIDQDYCVLVSTSRIQVWTGGQHRVKLGTYTREEGSIATDGLNRKAFWSSTKRNLAVLVSTAASRNGHFAVNHTSLCMHAASHRHSRSAIALFVENQHHN